MERQLREKEASYQRRLREWELRESRKAKEYEREKHKEEKIKGEEEKETRRLKEFLEDYDDERDDPKYYKGGSFSKRLRDRQKEMDNDEKDREQEKRELQELRDKLTQEGHPNPEGEARLRMSSSEHRDRHLKSVDEKIQALMMEARQKSGESQDGMSDNTPQETQVIKYLVQIISAYLFL